MEEWKELLICDVWHVKRNKCLSSWGAQELLTALLRGQVSFCLLILWLCSTALLPWRCSVLFGAAGKCEQWWILQFLVWSCSVIMQTMCGIWASLGVGYKELKGLGLFSLSKMKSDAD